jgi:hypothetical protein
MSGWRGDKTAWMLGFLRQPNLQNPGHAADVAAFRHSQRKTGDAQMSYRDKNLSARVFPQ